VRCSHLNSAALQNLAPISAPRRQVSGRGHQTPTWGDSLPIPRTSGGQPWATTHLATIGKGQTYIDLSTNAPSMV